MAFESVAFDSGAFDVAGAGGSDVLAGQDLTTALDQWLSEGASTGNEGAQARLITLYGAGDATTLLARFLQERQ